MVHVLMANGDIYTMGPVLPLHAEMPLRYLQGLKAYSDNRLRRVREESGNEDAERLCKRNGWKVWSSRFSEGMNIVGEGRRMSLRHHLDEPARSASGILVEPGK